MLRELHITNLAVIEDLTLELDEGLNCFTGQTGAGKSLILGAFEILLGLRAGGADVLRPGADEARVSGLFELADQRVIGEIARILDAGASSDHADGQLLITRKIFASGRTSVSINGQPATAGMVRAVGEQLVDIHGQHDHQYLLKPSNQLHILDRFAGCDDLREQYAQAYTRLRELVTRRAELLGSDTLRRQQLELYEFQADEIDAAAPMTGEYEELNARHRVLANLKKIQQEAGHAHAALYDSEGSVVERLQMIVHVLVDLAELDADLGETLEQIRGATLALQEGAFDLGRYIDRLEVNPQEVAEVEERLNTLNRLASKYGSGQRGVDACDEILAFRQQLQREIDRLRGENNDMAGLDEQAEQLRRQVQSLGAQLSKARRAAGAKLTPLVEKQLQALGMADAAMEVSFEPVTGDDDAAGGASGLESVEFMIRTNPGQPARPLRKIASGGELSRVMLAIKSILAGSDRISVLVFDEIDANIGGRMGTVIGGKLRELAKGTRSTAKASGGNFRGGHQVLCITHLPQIAAFADRHLRIEKAVVGKGKDKQTRTTVMVLDDATRIEELAEMLAGKNATDTTRDQVRELLAVAAK